MINTKSGNSGNSGKINISNEDLAKSSENLKRNMLEFLDNESKTPKENKVIFHETHVEVTEGYMSIFLSHETYQSIMSHPDFKELVKNNKVNKL